MTNRWAQWKVGIAGCSKTMFLRRMVKHGKLKCAKCGSGGHLALYEGGRGKCCHRPRKIEKISYAAKYLPRTEPFAQLPETLALRKRVDALMAAHGIAHLSAFARLIGLDKRGFSYWYRGHYGERGQGRMKIRIEAGIRRWQGEDEEDAAARFAASQTATVGHDTDEDERGNAFDDYEDAEPATVGNCWL